MLTQGSAPGYVEVSPSGLKTITDFTPFRLASNYMYVDAINYYNQHYCSIQGRNLIS